ncbi:MAG: carbon-nitrogen hydrolase family protein, partial [Burkholderiales bacterium]|nr:carbon-nitrogen hydrolase family protein [Anaerolineae bacterium]
GVQMAVVAWDADATIDKMEQTIHQIGRSFPWVQMVIFHELCAAAMVQFDATPDIHVWNSLQQPIPGRFTDRLCDIARRENKWILPGSLYERDGDKSYNTAVVISPEGEIVAKYRKLFPWYPMEAESPGTEFCVFDVPDVGRFGVSICYDMWFPEVIRALVWMGAEVILHPTMTPTSDRDLEVVLSQANAITNQCYFVDINGIGPWGGGRSMIVDPDGRVLQQSGTQETILTEILDLDRVTLTREYGNVGMAQTLKHLRDSNIKFPQYQTDFANGEGIKPLGKLQLHRDFKRGTI